MLNLCVHTKDYESLNMYVYILYEISYHFGKRNTTFCFALLFDSGLRHYISSHVCGLRTIVKYIKSNQFETIILALLQYYSTSLF